jgi:CTP:molybdopterin cytidylyltransferase MocA
MGTPKGLVEYEGESFLAWQVARLEEAAVREVVVVLGHGVDDYRARVRFVDRALASANRVTVGAIDVRVVLNSAPERGPFSSLGLALEALFGLEAAPSPARPDGVFVMPVDVPCPGPSTFRALLAAFDIENANLAQANVPRERVLTPEVASRGGHPVLLNRAFAGSVLARTHGESSQRLDHAIAELPPGARVRVPVDDVRVVLNLNTPEDFQRFAKLGLRP